MFRAATNSRLGAQIVRLAVEKEEGSIISITIKIKEECFSRFCVNAARAVGNHVALAPQFRHSIHQYAKASQGIPLKIVLCKTVQYLASRLEVGERGPDNPCAELIRNLGHLLKKEQQSPFKLSPLLYGRACGLLVFQLQSFD